MKILGISCFYHDAAAALVDDGRLVAAAEEERFSRKKHDAGFPAAAIEYCLEAGGISARGLDHVVFYEKPLVKFERILLSAMQSYPRSWRSFTDSMIAWMGDKLWVRDHIRERLGIDRSKLLFVDHHGSHAASAFYPSRFDKAAILTVDGVGEWTTASFGVGDGEKVRLLREIRFPHSLGLLYSVFTAFLGFEVNEGEYKVMGMAPYGQPRYVDKVWKLIELSSDGSFGLDMDYFAYHYSRDTAYSQKFLSLFGPPRRPGLNFFTTSSGYPSYFGPKPGNFAELVRANEHYADVAASIQKVTEEVLLAMVRAIHRETGLARLCLAGGVALNSVANGRIVRETPIEELYVQPAAGDSGGAIGAALYAYHALLGKPRTGRSMDHAYWGKEYGDGDVRAALERRGLRYHHFDDEARLLDATVGDLASGKVIGWYQGRFEWGPRALGNRSILGDPRRAEMKDIVNTKIKFREPYRPFAPSVLAEQAERFFDLTSAMQQDAARFMLLVVPVKNDAVPAVTHVDNSARLQTVFRDTNPRYYELIRRFGDATGVPVVLNTSFNLKGEPIVTTPDNALNTFFASEMDTLVVGNHVIYKSENT
ncbi:MAG: carbamoyltransferase [Deltaproteobacteria bacterium]|nr:carbamoyltransferase [Deltaproteobacteria bacterium]